MASGVGCRLDEGPAQVAGTVLGETATVVLSTGLVDPRAQPGVAGELLGAVEAGDVADLGRDGVGQDPADARDGEEQRHVWMAGSVVPQFCLQVADLGVEGVDESQRGLEVASPRFSNIDTAEEIASGHAEEV